MPSSRIGSRYETASLSRVPVNQFFKFQVDRASLGKGRRGDVTWVSSVRACWRSCAHPVPVEDDIAWSDYSSEGLNMHDTKKPICFEKKNRSSSWGSFPTQRWSSLVHASRDPILSISLAKPTVAT